MILSDIINLIILNPIIWLNCNRISYFLNISILVYILLSIFTYYSIKAMVTGKTVNDSIL